MQHRLVSPCGDTLRQRGAPHQMHGMIRMVTVMDFPAHDLAAVQIQDQVQVKPASHHYGGQTGHIPAPDLARLTGDVGGGRPDWTSPASVDLFQLPLRSRSRSSSLVRFCLGGLLAGWPVLLQARLTRRWRSPSTSEDQPGRHRVRGTRRFYPPHPLPR